MESRYLNRNQTISEGSQWFKRLFRECKRMSPHIRFKRIKHGFYRIYFRQAYLHEAHKGMGPKGYDIVEYDPRFESKSYYEQFEDNVDLTMKIKNFREGYYDSIGTIRRRAYMMKNNSEFFKEATRAYKQMKVY